MMNAEALDLFVRGADVVGQGIGEVSGQSVPSDELGPLRGVLQDIAAMVELDGLLDDLTADDARHTVAGAFADLVLKDGAESLRRRAAWVLTPEGAAPLAEPGKVSEALLRWALIVDSPV